MKNSYLVYLFILVIFTLGMISHLPGGGTKDSPFITDEKTLSEQELLGKRLFEDTNLSEPRGMSCATCHTPENAFQGNNHSRIPALAKGSREEHFGVRNVPTLAYAMYSPAFHFSTEKNEEGKMETKAVGGQFLDGRAADLPAQIEFPLLNDKEMNNPSKAVVVEKVKSAAYAPLVKKLFGDNVFDHPDEAFAKIALSIAAFENTRAFNPFSSKFDRVLAGKDSFTAEEEKGFELFKDPKKGNCLACHIGNEKSHDPKEWLFTDFTYDNLGLPRNKDIPETADANYFDLGLCKQPGIEKTAPKNVNLKEVCGAFKVPTLRNIALTAPYGHNGVFNHLRDVVKFYATRDTNPELWYPKNPDGSVNKFDDLPKEYHGNVNTQEVPYDRKPGEQPRLNEQEIGELVTFLNTLTDEKK